MSALVSSDDEMNPKKETMQDLEPASQYPVTASPEAMEQYHMQDELQKRN